MTPLISKPGKIRINPLGGGNASIATTLRTLAGLRNKYAQDVKIRQTVEKVIRSVTYDNHVQGQVNTILQFVKDHVTYVRDPNAWEYVKTPDLMLKEISEYGKTMGDCDDHVLLFNTMLDTIGIKTKFVAVIINGATTFNHVVSAVYMDKQWVDLDPCAKRVSQPFFETRLEV